MRNVWIGTAVLLWACGGGGDQTGKQEESPRADPADGQPAGGGTIQGKVSFAGTPPANRTIDMTEEPACKSKNSTPPVDPVVVVEGGLANVLVYVKSGLPAGQKYEAPKEPAILDQAGCLYSPRTLGVMVNQQIVIRNSDPVLHNVKAMAKKNRPFNISQPQAGMETIRTFTVEELTIPMECNVHGWMRGNVGVVSHPFFAVSGPSGDFTIRGLPPGDYTLEAWHERFGTKTVTASVATDGEATVSIGYSPS